MASPRASSWRRHVRHSMTLAVNVPKAMWLAGGPLPFAALAWRRLTTHGLSHWLTWLIGAVSWVQRANAVWYRRWLAAEATAAPAQASVPTLLVCSTTGLSEDVVAGYLEAVAGSECFPQTHRLLVTDAAGCARLQAGAHATQRGLLEVVRVEQLSAGIVADCAKSRFEAGGAGYQLLGAAAAGVLARRGALARQRRRGALLRRRRLRRRGRATPNSVLQVRILARPAHAPRLPLLVDGIDERVGGAFVASACCRPLRSRAHAGGGRGSSGAHRCVRRAPPLAFPQYRRWPLCPRRATCSRFCAIDTAKVPR